MSTYLVGPPPEGFTPPIKDCPQCDHVCQSTVDSSKVDEIHAWLSELMPVARTAMKLFATKQKLMSRWVKDAK